MTSRVKSGDVVGSYRIRDSVGSGRVGEVYSAERSGQIFILKVLTPECSATPAAVSLYHQQAQQAGRIDHPSIERIVECGHAPNGSAFTSRPFVPALSLADFISKKGPLAPLTAVQLMRQVADALDHSHKNGLQHRALSSSNVLICLDTPEVPRAVIVDYGISEIRADAEKRGLPASGIEFRSPEQCLGGNRVDQRSDLYSLGCLLFYCLCGVPIFNGDEKDVRAAHIRTQPPPVATRAPSTPTELASLVAALLQKSVDNRPPNAISVVRALTDVAHRLAPAPKPPAPSPALPPQQPSASVAPPIPPPGIAPPGSHSAAMAAQPGPAPVRMGAPPGMPPMSPVETEIRPPIPPSAPPPMAMQAPAAASQPVPMPEPEPTATATGTARTERTKSARRSHTLGLSVLIVGALAAAAAALYIAQSGSLSSGSTPEAKAAAAPPATTAPVTAEKEPATDDKLATSVTPTSPTGTEDVTPLRENGAPDRPAGLVTLTIESEPAGATLTRKKDGVTLGTTPFVYQIEPARGIQEFAIELAGYKPATVSLPGDRDGVRQVLLLRDKNAVITDPAPSGDAPLPERGETAARRAADAEAQPVPDRIDEERARTPRAAEARPQRKSKPRATTRSSNSAKSTSDSGKSGVVDYTAPPVPL